MRGWRVALVAALGSVSVQSGAADTVAPRGTVEAVAKRIEETYFDPARAARIAAELRKEAGSGRYDRLTEPHDLANALSERLKDEDRHFSVSWVGLAPPGAAEPQQRGPDPEIAARRSGYGFRRIEILPGNVGYIELKGFAPINFDDKEWPVWKAADAALAMMANADAVIVDLRDNGGGAPSMVGYLASAFVKADADVYNVFHSREGTQSEAPGVKYAKPMLDKPVYVLVSGRTGSAAEAFAYTLQAAKRATIVGEASAGAANPGGPVPTGTGFTVFISGASPKNPLTGGNWETQGVVPEVKVAAGEALAAAHKLALQTALPKLPEAERLDAQWALDALGAVEARGDYAALTGKYGSLEVLVAAGRLEVRQGRRPPLRLRTLGPDLFYTEGDPARRYAFVRDAQGKTVAVEVRFADGTSNRYSRS